MISMDLHARFAQRQWGANIVRGPLTDRAIERYRDAGFYSEEFRAARREFMAKKAARRRVGNFVEAEDGRLIYSPR